MQTQELPRVTNKADQITTLFHLLFFFPDSCPGAYDALSDYIRSLRLWLQTADKARGRGRERKKKSLSVIYAADLCPQ